MDMLDHIRGLLELIAPAVEDRETIDALLGVLADRRRLGECHAIFDRIRDKTLRAIEAEDQRAGIQYSFEEICAKSMYNEASIFDPFDSDSPYWVVPFAFGVARMLGIPDARVLEIVMREG
jgi:hypothetical protein